MAVFSTHRLSHLYNMVSRTNSVVICVIIAVSLLQLGEALTANNTIIDAHVESSTAPIITKLLPTTGQNHNESGARDDAIITTSTVKSHAVHVKKLSTNNELWDALINDCLRMPTMSCFQKNVHTYLDGALAMQDVNVTGNFKFLQNKVDPHKYGKEANGQDEIENDIPDEDEARSASPIEEVTDALSGKGVMFLMSHDIELKMPDVLFDGATFRISPREMEGNGALVKLELIPKAIAQAKEEAGRIIFKPIKKIKKFFRNKLLLSFFAIVLVIKLIKIKILWILPFLVGVGAAKKLLLKFVLFLFPALANIFKLCGYYHKNYHQETKYHHHQHQISHLHTVLPQWANEPHVDHSLSGHSHEPEIIYTHPPKGHPSEYIHGGPPVHGHYASDWESSGPGLGSEYISDRNAQVNSFKPKVDDSNEINSWGLGGASTQHPPLPHPVQQPHILHGQNQNIIPYLKKASSRIVTGVSSFHNPVYAPPKRTQLSPQVAAQYTTVTDPKMLREAQRLQAKQQEAIRIQAEQKLIVQQQKILQQQPFVQNLEDTAALIDPFYSPLLAKIDKIMLQLGFTDEPCRERLLCSMYKNPAKYSPHSNFISAELSKETSELYKPASSNTAVIRFYRYVQAARDGQDQRDCLRAYAQCTINTER